MPPYLFEYKGEKIYLTDFITYTYAGLVAIYIVLRIAIEIHKLFSESSN